MPEEEVVPAAHRSAWWRRMSPRMRRASDSFNEHLRDTVRTGRRVDESFYDELTEALIAADTGVGVAERVVVTLRDVVRNEAIHDTGEAVAALKRVLAQIMAKDRELHISDRPSVVLLVGVNGSGKTTTTGKLAHRLRAEGRTVLVAAADTYRAAAIDQLRVWADRGGAEVVAHQPGGDPGAVVFDAIQAAQARRTDTVLVDTAGRLQTKANLMAELAKMRRVAERLIPEAPQETLLVIEAATGLNALQQARAFHEAMQLTGLVVTKLDGTGRAGTVLAIEEELGVPVKLVGLGEGIDDLNVFDPPAYLDALFNP
ncbi:MAG: signal recognition particle-docking protein FtsY [Candidatus Dormibacteraeota bacterium]|nr:signal recognition particle-docking protein FtsY [Candidatus Dormibacteraeota bacterium]MBV8444885.1 signal recognition particle-docking protein FtsY [Candidatus Dormibacteraeota bacterium]